MKDIPVFTTENGVASLTLREIPYRAAAYVRIQSSQDPRELIRECADFCRVCGAEHVYAAGCPELEAYPLHTAVLEMSCGVSRLPDTDAQLWPVREHNLENFRTLYNERMAQVPNAAWMTEKMGREMLEKGDGCFIHREDELLGLGRASGNRLDAVIALVPGAGAEVVSALAHMLHTEQVVLEVASANTRAVRLYGKLGFTCTREISRWFEIF